ncbi:StAR-related lipid transfer protein 5 [Tupaia chinensis]|uniref:StAR-related lipid transfer protein 5 n=1 Tax=Tupaia chinensis TaxID=246437 RepID=L9LAD6_TUPCH|nr:StAR-related lipid transfer protein 5 [Tupaia chinensis]
MDPTLAAQMSEEVAEKMLQYRRDSSSWKICREGNGVSVSWRPSVEFPGNLYRGEGVVLGTPEEVWECVKPVAGGLRVKWDENVNGFEVIQSITDAPTSIPFVLGNVALGAHDQWWERPGVLAGWERHSARRRSGLPLPWQTLCVSRTSTPSAAMKLISPRDFVDLVLIRKYEDGTISSNATHVEHPLCPPKPGFVRGFNHPCGCFCEPVPGEPGKTNLVTFFQTDLSGYLPKSVVDSFFPRSMAGFYSNLQKAMKQFHD